MDYDFIIIGAGSAGCALASRLSEDPDKSVLLLEAGPDYPDASLLPDDLRYDSNQAASEVNAPHNWSLVGYGAVGSSNELPVARGKVTGGTSAINHQIFLRGAPEDYDHWASLGNDEWEYRKVLPYFRKLESDQDVLGDFHGSTGPIPVRRHHQEHWLPLQAAFYRACRDTGFPDDPDMNHPDTTGVGQVPLNNPDGVRMSTALGYLDACRHRLNLTIRSNVLVKKVLLAGDKAVGVEAESGGETFQVQCRETILSAGAVASPQLLLLSGVGPEDQLNELGIPVIRNLPGVGRNMMNHPSVSLRFKPAESYTLEPDSPRNQVGLRFAAPGSGDRNDIQVQPLTSGPRGREAEQISVGCRLELPRSVGELRLTSADTNVQPQLDYRFLADAWDLERLRKAVRVCVDLFRHEAFQDLIENLIAPAAADLASDAGLDAWIARTVSIAGHTCGTCKMGPAEDDMAVVDQYCRVRGLDNLRVIDASVMPTVPRANTNATAIMIAERAADFIQQQVK